MRCRHGFGMQLSLVQRENQRALCFHFLHFPKRLVSELVSHQQRRQDRISKYRRPSLTHLSAHHKPNLDGAGTTGGIIGGLIAGIVALAVVATGVLICRQQQKNRMDHEEDDLEGPPPYKPPPPCQLSDETEPVPNPNEVENIPLKSSYLEPSATEDFFGGVAPTTTEEAPRYHELPTLEEREAASEAGPGLEDDDYLDQINPIYDGLSFPAMEDEAALTPLPTDKAFVMSRAMYV
nr:PREDICTED: nectin-2 [Anolis carolinensis]|eukprot:XP_016853875.1 PREDICTED: nectin-2 [Anolis carolinensis]